ncbi:hypothetical protein BDC45DRAFT_494256 [Circinella umbellata]|nr:hypothetical protein BDC45DRAFT_494256 [Circinella umbellata]
MYYEGFETLEAYVKETAAPVFNAFVACNTTNIARWSANYGLNANDLYGTWRRRFAILLKAYQKTECLESSKKIDTETWVLIKRLAEAMNKSTLTAQISALDAMMAAAPTMANILKEVIEEEAKERQDETGPEPDEPDELVEPAGPRQFNDYNDEARINLLAHKKLSGMLLADYEIAYLKSISNDGTMKGCLLFLAAGRLLLDQLENLDIILIKLAASRIVNFMNKDIKDIIENNISGDVASSVLKKIRDISFLY